MRRSELKRGAALARKTSLGASSATLRRSEGLGRGKRQGRGKPGRAERRRAAPGRDDWFDFRRWGRCECCGRHGFREAHHVLLEAYVEQVAPERIFDVRNRWLLGVACGCHPSHHSYGVRDARLPRSKIPPVALAFVWELLGEAAERYLERRYRAA